MPPTRRLDILYGGTPEKAMEECLHIARETLQILAPDERVLLINSIQAYDDLQTTLSKWPTRDRERFRDFSGLADTIPPRLDFLMGVIETMNVRLLLLNVYEFAAMNPRHKSQLLNFLRRARNKHNVHVIVVTINTPNNVGTMGGLKYMAQSIEPIDAWRTEPSAEELLAIPIEGSSDHTPPALPEKTSDSEPVSVTPQSVSIDLSQERESPVRQEAPEGGSAGKGLLKNNNLARQNVRHTPSVEDVQRVPAQSVSRMAA